jgi:4-carboxymuconolactone decarboxylase
LTTVNQQSSRQTITGTATPTDSTPTLRRAVVALGVGHALVGVLYAVATAPGTAVEWLSLGLFAVPGLGAALVRRDPTVRSGTLVFLLGLVASAVAVFTGGVAAVGPTATLPVTGWEVPALLPLAGLTATTTVGLSLGLALLWGGTRGESVPQSGRLVGVPWTGPRPLVRFVYWAGHRVVGSLPESMTVLAHHRRLLVGVGVFELVVQSATSVDPKLEALAVQKAATSVGCAFCIDIGAAEAAAVGITPAQLNDLTVFEESDAFSERERLVLRYASAMSETPVAVSDDLFEELRAVFSAEQLVELTATVAWEHYRARFNHAMGLQAQGFAR